MPKIQKSGVTPNFVPKPYHRGKVRRAYLLGWQHGHGIACHNVPTMGNDMWLEALGDVTVTPDNIAEVHHALCFVAAEHSRCYSPFEFTAHEFNSDEEHREELWEAFEAGESDAIAADLRTYTYDLEVA